jgi:hypothetical protein
MTNIANAKKMLIRKFSITDRMKRTQAGMFLTFVPRRWLSASSVNSFFAMDMKERTE